MNKTCPDCGGENAMYTLKLVATNRKDDLYPKYIPQIKESCGNCGRYLRFAKQTPETIAMVNEWLEVFIMKHSSENEEDYETWLNK